MALSSFVFVSDVDNLSDARYAAGMAVDLIGFKLDPGDESSLSQDQFKEISEWISGVKIVGEFGDQSAEIFKSLLEQFRIDYLLISDETKIQECSSLGIPLILSLNINEHEDLEGTVNYCSELVDFFVLESSNESISDTNRVLIQNIAQNHPLLLGYGINENNAPSLVSELNLKGIVLKGSPELRPGYKDFDEMADILEALDVD